MRLSPLVAVCLAAPALKADPCGMVPPVYTGPGNAIERVGAQRTYVFYRNGVETFVIRPGFTGQVDNFGMLIPFPSPPAIRKVPDDIFEHIAAAIDPPEVTVHFYQAYDGIRGMGMAGAGKGAGPSSIDSLTAAPKKDEVRVLRREAVGMYEVAVLEAGSPAALARWMDLNGYTYPEGMDAAVADYVEDRWAFVAVKTRVGNKGATAPKPGMRSVDPALPAGASFDGAVQAMGFRFVTPKFIVPMRLSGFNEGELHNIVYILTDRPTRIEQIERDLVVRQVPGRDLGRNLEILPVRFINGPLEAFGNAGFKKIAKGRDATPFSGKAKELFGSDIRAANKKRLNLPFEEKEKVLLRVSEALDLRGGAIDAAHAAALETEKMQTVGRAIQGIGNLTMTVVDGDFPREVLRDHNLTFARFTMPAAENTEAVYNARARGPGGNDQGFVVRGTPNVRPKPKSKPNKGGTGLAQVLGTLGGLGELQWRVTYPKPGTAPAGCLRSRGQLAQILRRMQAPIKQCVTGVGLELPITMNLQLDVSGSGRNVRVRNLALQNRKLDVCLTRAMRRAPIGGSAGGNCRVRLKIKFQ